MRIARQLLSDLQHPFLLPEQQVTLSCSIGMAFAPRHGAGDTLLGCADAAMYAAKRSGGSCALCYDTHMASADSADQLQLQQGLREALQRGQLALHFQPKLSAADGSLHGVEALLRWRHPERGRCCRCRHRPTARRACGRRRRPERSGSMGASIDAAMLRPPCTTAEPCSRRPS